MKGAGVRGGCGVSVPFRQAALLGALVFSEQPDLPRSASEAPPGRGWAVLVPQAVSPGQSGCAEPPPGDAHSRGSPSPASLTRDVAFKAS